MENILYQNEKPLFPDILWQRPVHFYKSKAGRILVIAGSRGAANLALLTCEAVFRSGTGILTLAFPEELKPILTEVLPEAMTLTLPQTHSGSIARKALSEIEEQLKSSDLVILGPGLSTNTETVQFVWELLQQTEGYVVIDDDGLKALVYGIEAIRKKEGTDRVKEYFAKLKAKIILTIKTEEASKILEALKYSKDELKAKYIENHQIETASIIQSYLGGLVILEDGQTIVTDGKKSLSDSGSTSTSNSILSGLVGSFIAQNPTKSFEAAVTSVYLHGLAQKLAAQTKKDISPNDVLKYLPEAIKEAEK